MSTKQSQDTAYFGIHDLPQEQKDTLRKAIRLERINVVVKIIAVIAIYSVSGSSQVMKAAWIEDSLAILPPLAFLIAIRYSSRKPTPRHPYGFHRSMGVGHVVAAVALLVFGGILLVDSALGLIGGERPPIGLVEVFGTPIWAGWIMIGVSLLVVIPSVIIGRMNMKLAPVLNNKVLYADAAMNKADWMTGLATGVGLLGVGAGIWWFDAAAAIVISLDIISDGVKNLRGSLADLIDARVTETDSRTPHPLIVDVREKALEYDWVDEADVRMRDQGQVFHTEVFVVPAMDGRPSVEELEEARTTLADMDWRLHDLVVIPVNEMPDEFIPQVDEKED